MQRSYDSLINAAVRRKDNPFQGKRTQERRKELVPYKKKSIEETRAKRKAFIAYPGREW